ncbi:hypothetical protein CPB85DRAFT_992911 [Mucidula mucida]|nr:hypothetical protein CPB85DRAFT_992911 [Mucidula mucida]
MSQGPGVVEVYTDGSYTRKRGRGWGGLGVWWGPNDPWNLSERCPDSSEGSSLLSELHAFRRLLEELVDPRNTPLYVGSTNSWRRFRKSGFVKKDGKPITHVNLLYHIGGHNGSEGNEGADFLAKQGAARPWAAPEPDWNMLERRVRRKLADLKGEEEAWAEKKRKHAEESSSPRKKLRKDTNAATERNQRSLLHRTPTVSTNVAFLALPRL